MLDLRGIIHNVLVVVQKRTATAAPLPSHPARDDEACQSADNQQSKRCVLVRIMSCSKERLARANMLNMGTSYRLEGSRNRQDSG
jgi:hypothetical protein